MATPVTRDSNTRRVPDQIGAAARAHLRIVGGPNLLMALAVFLVVWVRLG